MEPSYVYLCGFCDLLFLLSLLLVASLITSWVFITIKARRMPNAYERRLMQIQIDKVQTEKELSKLTQDYVQRVSIYAQHQRSQKVNNRTPSNNGETAKQKGGAR